MSRPPSSGRRPRAVAPRSEPVSPSATSPARRWLTRPSGSLRLNFVSDDPLHGAATAADPRRDRDMLQGLTGRVALVTGGASGIGLATVRELAGRGVRVVLADVSERTEEAARDVGGDVLAARVDVTSAAEVGACFARAAQEFGPVDLVFNNAGVPPRGDLLQDTSLEEFERVIKVNLFGVFNVLTEALRTMRAEAAPGAIVNTASISGLRGFAGGGTYVASKHAVVGLTRSAALEVAPFGIRVNAVAPGGVSTPFVGSSPAADLIAARRSPTAPSPLGRTAEPEEIAKLVTWLLSD